MTETSITEVICCKPSDIISNLPCDVISDILKRLPLRDAVRTSILSRKWRYNWTKLTELTLDHTLWNETKQDISKPRITFAMILYQLLSLHQGPITKCTISIPDLKDCPEIDNLMLFLSKNGVEHLVLQLSKNKRYKLPSSVFKCSRTRHLSLRNCLINAPPTFEPFSRLHTLELINVTISDKWHANLLSHCPLLEYEYLWLRSSSPLNCVEVNAPQLRYFYIGGEINSVCFKNTPLLADVSIHALDHESFEGRCNLVNFFVSLPAVEKLSLDYFIIKTLIAGVDKIPLRLPVLLLRLRKLSLFCFCPGVLDEVCCLLCLIRSSPHLEEIQFEMFNCKGDEVLALECLEVEYNSNIKLNHLSKAVLLAFSGKKTQMELIKLLLVKSPLLETMIIEPWIKPKSPQTLIEIVKQVKEFQRASPRAKVVFRD